MDRSASSKVTVEYYDPSGIFPLVSPQLAARLPLRNLHWKAPTRPLRSIDSLHVDLVPAGELEAGSGAASTSTDQTPLRPSSGKKDDGAKDGAKAPSKERRHQIPGLRQTPYLKLYLLRCDDNETYKATSRRLLREWIKTQGAQTSSSANSSEKHDAFEWMILHVVLPNTAACSQPRWTGASKDGSGTSGEKSSSTWRPGRSSSTIFEKIRADFNGSSKSAPDHVAQIRLTKEFIPDEQLPPNQTPPIVPYVETQQEQDHAVSDLIAKFKSLILLSFDQRVSHYEEDIREKDSQRALPGWNFCTFFVLKEGLARGFENVGLVEDALVMYDELSVGLDAVIRDQADGSEGSGGSFLESTADLTSALAAVAEGQHPSDFIGQKPVESTRKRYRELILSTNISIFDFRCYVFSRQMSLLLRLGNAHSARSELTSKLAPGKALAHQRSRDDLSLARNNDVIESPEDLEPLAELCERALRFVTSAAREMRIDLQTGAGTREIENANDVVENLIASWSYAVVQQVLDETRTSALPITMFRKDLNSNTSSKSMPIKEPKVAIPEPKTMIHPARSTSLSNRRNSLSEPPYAATPQSGQVVFDHGTFPGPTGNRTEEMTHQTNLALQELAAYRAELYLVQRRLLVHVGKAAGWSIGWSALTSTQSVKNEDLSDVSLDGSDDSSSSGQGAEKEKSESFTMKGLLSAELEQALESIHNFRNVYENLCDMALRHYMAANRTKAGESIFGDLASLKFQLGDYTAAAMYFSKMAPMFAAGRWNFVEMTMLKMYSKCLKELHRKGDYVSTLLDILAKSAARWRTASVPQITAPPADPTETGSSVWLNDDAVDTTGFLTELVDMAGQIPNEIIVPMARYFDRISIEPYAKPYDEKDGFQLRLSFRHLLEDTISIERFKVRLVSASSTQAKEIWLEKNKSMVITRGTHKVWLDSNITTFGTYVVDKIQLEVKKLRFIHEPLNKSESTTPLGLPTSLSGTSIRVAKKSRILCYPTVDSFYAKMSLTRQIRIDKSRSILVHISSGRNEIQKCDVRFRSASAGLRIRTADAEVVSGNAKLDSPSGPGVVVLSEVSSGEELTLQIPYDVEMGLPELIIRMEATYTTSAGEFVWSSSSTIPIELPLDVNVHDHFKSSIVFSRFNIKTANTIPLEVLDVKLDGTDAFKVSSPPSLPTPMMVFPKQPASIMYKITPLVTTRKEEKEAPLSLTVGYRCADEDFTACVEHSFSKDLANSSFAQLERLLVPVFIEKVQQRVLASQYERIALLKKVSLGPFDQLGWNDYVDHLPTSLREGLKSWLEEWHNTHNTIDLSEESSVSATTTRRIVITVPVPRVHVVQTASLRFSPTSYCIPRPTPTSPPLVSVGHPLSATLTIWHTRRWASPTSLQKAAPQLSNASAALDFIYEISAQPDIWLIGGQRRAVFSAREGDEHTFDLVLVPLRQGNWLLPNVEVRVKPVTAAAGGAAEDAPQTEVEELTCETDYANVGETVLVFADLRRTTVGIAGLGPPGGLHPGGATVLLDAEEGRGRVVDVVE